MCDISCGVCLSLPLGVGVNVHIICVCVFVHRYHFHAVYLIQFSCGVRVSGVWVAQQFRPVCLT